MTTHLHLEGLIRKWDHVISELRAHGRTEAANAVDLCSQDLAEALAALPGGGVDDLESDFDTVVEHNIELQGVILDAIKIHSSFNTTADMADWLRDALEAAALTTPPPHEADRNG